MQGMRSAIEFESTFDIVSLSIAPILFVIVCLMRFARLDYVIYSA